MTPQQRQQLVQALALVAQGGSAAERGFKVVYDAFWGRCVARFMGRGQPQGVAQDLASDTLVKVAAKLKDLRDPVALERWVNVVATNTLLDHLRAHRREREHTVALDDDTDETLAEQLIDHSQGDPGIQRCLAQQLALFCRDEPQRGGLLTGMALDGWSIDEAAQAIGRTAGATKEYLSQCRKLLWRYLSLCMNGTP